MKHFSFLQVVIAALLMVTAISCTTVREVYEDDEEGYYSGSRRGAPGRIYVDDPYYGTVVLERDPYSGRYYQVGPYGNSIRYNTYDRYYRGGYGGNWNRGGGYYGGDYRTPSSRNNQPSAEQRRQVEQKKSDARSKVLGNN